MVRTAEFTALEEGGQVMAGIDRSPPQGSASAAYVRAYRDARLVAMRAQRIGEEELERELEALDDSVAGSDHHELAELRAKVPNRG